LKEETMANGTRPVVLVLTLVVGLAVGWLIGHGQAPTPPPPPPPPPPTMAPPPSPTPTPGDHLIEVGPAAKDVSDPEAHISKSADHKVIWIAKDETKDMRIVFQASDFPDHKPPFNGGKPGVDQVIKCKANDVCKSGHINPEVTPPDPPAKGLYYKYYQILIKNGQEERADAGIIIEK
jgi:hypothetical protein